MSTIVVVKKNGVAAIGADTLTKYGDTKESARFTENFSKIIRVGDSYLAFVGHASFGLVLNSYFSKFAEPPMLNSRQSIFETACQMHTALKRDYFLDPAEEDDDTFESSQLDCLIGNPAGIFGLYTLRFVQQYSKFYAFGSGAQYALGAMSAIYETASSAEAIARSALTAAGDFDDGTEGPYEVSTVLGPE